MESIKIGRREFRVVKREGDFITVERDLKSEGKVIGKTTYDIPKDAATAAKVFVEKSFYTSLVYGLDLEARSSDRPREAVQDDLIKINGVETSITSLALGKAIKIINGVLAASDAGVKVPGIGKYQFAKDKLVSGGKAIVKDGVLVVAPPKA